MSSAPRQESFEEAVGRHKKILYKVCHAYCRDRSAQEDLAQEILFQLWRSFPTFDGRCQFSTWMYRIALNVAISFERREGRRRRWIVSDEALLDSAPSAAEPEEIRALYDFIAGLEPLPKALLLLYLDGYSHREIAATLGITETNVATKINRLKNQLREEQGTWT
jgi:RNA polymerase sigma factor (sigma-70 family)